MISSGILSGPPGLYRMPAAANLLPPILPNWVVDFRAGNLFITTMPLGIKPGFFAVLRPEHVLGSKPSYDNALFTRANHLFLTVKTVGD
jgi:hypothetical protein